MEKWQKTLEEALKQNIRFVNILFTNLSGRLLVVQIPIDEFEDATKYGVGFDGSSAKFTEVEKSDLLLRPDPNTLRIARWAKPPMAIAIGEIYEGGAPSELDPRNVLKSAISELKKTLGEGVEYLTSPEIEFWLLKPTPSGDVELHDRGTYFTAPPEDLGYEIRLEIASALKSMDIYPEKIHHEVPPAKHEIDFKYADAITTADNVLIYKYTVRTIASYYGLIASFMPKPFYGTYGAGMHTHQSLYDSNRGVNLFYGDKQSLSDTAFYYIGGLVKFAKEITAITNPTVNSYKRLVPGWEAPVYITWARYNRSALIRVPMTTNPRKVRIEYRATDGTCNPYIAFAAMLAAGLEGIKNRIEPPEPLEENVYRMSEEERKAKGIEVLPSSLKEALDVFEKSDLAKRTLGERAFRKFLELKREEWREYSLIVTPWERQKYLYY
ncbi:MAG: type I glutamate--ammonia ligase [Desulfurococcaceae archaeon]